MIRHLFIWISTGVLLIACTDSNVVLSLQHATVLEAPRPVAQFRLTDQTGSEFTNADLSGQWSIIFSGFTYCPDVCPLTLAQLREVEQQLGNLRHHRTVFVSVDPERDTPALLAQYLGWFNPDWIGLTGTAQELSTLLDSLGMAQVRVPIGQGGDYTVDHSTAVVLIDPQARMIGYWKAPLDARQLAEDLAILPTP
jgi:protein SCO1/2